MNLFFLFQHHKELHPDLSRYEYQCRLQPLSNTKEKSCRGRKTFTDLSSFKNHCMEKHDKDFELPFKCSICDAKFILEESLLCHQKSEHVHNVNTAQCDHCPRIFFSKAAKGGKYLVFVSSRSVKMRGSSAFSVCIFLRKVCLFFNF